MAKGAAEYGRLVRSDAPFQWRRPDRGRFPVCARGASVGISGLGFGAPSSKGLHPSPRLRPVAAPQLGRLVRMRSRVIRHAIPPSGLADLSRSLHFGTPRSVDLEGEAGGRYRTDLCRIVSRVSNSAVAPPARRGQGRGEGKSVVGVRWIIWITMYVAMSTNTTSVPRFIFSLRERMRWCIRAAAPL